MAPQVKPAAPAIEEADMDSFMGNEAPLKVTPARMLPQEKIKEHVERLASEETTVRKTNTGLKEEDFQAMDKDVNGLVDDIMKADINSQRLKEIVASIETMGNDVARRNAAAHKRLLEKPLRHLKGESSDPTLQVLEQLNNLRTMAIKLNPKEAQSFKNNKLFGFNIPFNLGRKADDVVQNFRNSEDQLNDISNNLRAGRDELEADNIAMEDERSQQYARLSEHEQNAYLAEVLYKRLAKRVESIRDTDPLRASAIETELMYPLGQKRLDFLQDMTVAMNSYMSYQTIIQNNRELIRGVNRAITTTMQALSDAVIQSQLLDRQGRILEGLQALNQTASDIIEANAKRNEEQGIAIARGAAKSTLDIEALSRTMESIVRTVEGVQKYRAESLVVMEQGAEMLKGLVNRGKEGLDIIAQGRAGNIMSEVSKEAEDESNGKNVNSNGTKRVKIGG